MSQRKEQWMPRESSGVAHWLIHHSARRAPDFLSTRLEEEWLADLESRSSTLSRLRLALGCCWATLVIVNDTAPVPVPAPSPAVTARRSSALADPPPFGYVSLRSATLFLILGLHAALFGGLTTTLSHTQGLATATTLQTQELTPLPPEIEIIALPRR